MAIHFFSFFISLEVAFGTSVFLSLRIAGGGLWHFSYLLVPLEVAIGTSALVRSNKALQFIPLSIVPGVA
jgi:hypothetical protein